MTADPKGRTTMTPSETLRAAAAKVRELNTAMGDYAGLRWEASSSDPTREDMRDAIWDETGVCLTTGLSDADADWIAAMSPVMAEPLAALLEAYIPLVEDLEQFGLSGYSRQLTLARLILGETP